MNEDKKFFDVGEPGTVGAHPTSKPVIVGHHPQMPDPMVRSNNPNPLAPSRPVSSSNTVDLSNMNPAPASGPSPDPLYRDSQPDSLITPTTAGVAGAVGPQQLPQTPTNPNQPPVGGEELHVPAGHASHKQKPRVWVWVLITLLLLAGAYAAVDAKTDVLPFHIFTHAKQAANTDTSDSSAQNSGQNSNQQSALAGFTLYQPTGTPVAFSYPDTWGTPTTTTDPGFSQRGTGKKADGVHAYIVSFATNKDVEVAITSAKNLPPARGTLYYDFLQWCVGSNDNKFYKQILHFTTASGVDTPSTTTCDQGPLADAVKLTDAIIVQANAKDASGASLGDVYTANLSDANITVLRVKDAKMQSSADIKKLLGTIHGATTKSQ